MVGFRDSSRDEFRYLVFDAKNMAMLGMNVVKDTATILVRLDDRPAQSFEAVATIAIGIVRIAKASILRRYTPISANLDIDLNGENEPALPVSLALATKAMIESLRDLGKAAAYKVNPSTAKR